MASHILTLNAGSSSLKFSLWQSGTGMDLRELFRGEVEKIGIDPHLSAWGPGGEAVINRGFGEGGANLTPTRIFCESSLRGFRSSARTSLRRSATASCTAAHIYRAGLHQRGRFGQAVKTGATRVTASTP
jgi:hypothetical protein